MESTAIHSFSTHVPFKQPIVITHYISMVIAFLGCYPLLLTQHIRRQKVYIISISLFFASIGFVSGSFIQQPEATAASILLRSVALILLCLLNLQAILLIYRSTFIAERFPTLHSLIPVKLSKIPKWVDIALGWFILIIATSYLTLAAMVYTESCTSSDVQSQCIMPIAMGTGFLIYGSMALLHLLAIIKLPRPSTPEYYEGVILTFWGFISLLVAGTPILGTEWRAINLGLLWFTGGLFSISLSVQTWIPALRERNIINSLIICLTGRAIVTGLTETQDTYAEQVHTMLGYILIIGAIARLTQIIFRKSPADNLPHRMFQQNTDTTLDIDDDEEDETKNDVLMQKNDNKICKHRVIFSTITLISGLLASILSICGGILFMGSNTGWIRYMKYYIQDPSTYVNITVAVAFLWSAYIFGLSTIYKNLRTSNALHQYEYMELENSIAMTTTDLHIRRNNDHFDLPPPAPSTISASIIPTSSAIMMPSSPPSITTDYLMSNSPPDTPQLYSSPIQQQQQNESNISSSNISEKTIRPSEYRAKRRSLLVQSPILNNNLGRARSSSGFGVGGVLPDEIIQLQKINSPPVDRRSWVSSGSSVSMDSSAPNSPLFENNRPYSSISSTLPSTNTYQHQQRRNSSVNNNEFDILVVRTEEERSVHNTESGKRRRLINYNSESSNSSHNLVISNSSGSKFQHWSSSSQYQRSDSISNKGMHDYQKK